MCNKVFKPLCNLKRYSRTHELEGVFFPCNLCSKTYESEQALKKHFMNLHTKGENCENIRNMIENKRKQNNICTICKKDIDKK